MPRREGASRRKKRGTATHLCTSWQPSHFFLSADRTFIPRLASAQAPTARAPVLDRLPEAAVRARSEAGRTEARSELAERRADDETSWDDDAGVERPSGRRSEMRRGSMAGREEIGSRGTVVGWVLGGRGSRSAGWGCCWWAEEPKTGGRAAAAGRLLTATPSTTRTLSLTSSQFDARPSQRSVLGHALCSPRLELVRGR